MPTGLRTYPWHDDVLVFAKPMSSAALSPSSSQIGAQFPTSPAPCAVQLQWDRHLLAIQLIMLRKPAGETLSQGDSPLGPTLRPRTSVSLVTVPSQRQGSLVYAGPGSVSLTKLRRHAVGIMRISVLPLWSQTQQAHVITDNVTLPHCPYRKSTACWCRCAQRISN